MIPQARRPGLEPLWVGLANRFGASDRAVASVQLRGLGDESRAALADLLGLDRLPSPSCRVRVADVARALGVDEDGEAGVRRIVEELIGPLGNRALDRQRERARREELWTWLDCEANRLGLSEWAASVRALGVPGRDVDAHSARLERAVAVLDRLFSSEAAPAVLTHLAADVLGDPHGLDPGQPVAALVVEALASRSGGSRVRSAEVVRAVWASAGVAADELSPTVLSLGLRSFGDDPLARMLGVLTDTGEAAVLTLAQLRRWEVRTDAPFVLVVENPSIVAHFAARPPSSPSVPIICTGGWPNVAAMTLLRQLTDSGCVLHCHADFDPAGILIVRHLVERVRAEPWEMTAAAYLGAVDQSIATFDGSVADTPWDPALGGAMRDCSRIVFEEDVRQSLLAGWLVRDDGPAPTRRDLRR